MKRLFDICLSISALIFLLPLLLLVAITIKLTSKGSIFYKQTRVGLQGITFQIYKFRSMVSDADKVGPYYTSVNDARVTKIGKFIRRTSIDELPQLINVIVGHMSIVGPRPNVPAQEEIYDKYDWNKRNSVKPGITGLAQATVRSATTFEERNKLDMEYIDNHTFFYDLKIIALTVKQILKKGGY